MKALREMVLAHSSYAKAAGLQSEINKRTVGRVAGSEVENKRLMNLYRKDMMLTISNVRREEKVLKKSMVRYSRKRRQNKIERRKREQENLERDKKTQEHLNVLMVWRDKTETPVNENKSVVLPEIDINNVNCIENITDQEKELKESKYCEDIFDENKDKKSDNRNNVKNSEFDFQTSASTLQLPAIVEDNEQEINEEIENKEEEDTKLLEMEDSGFQEINTTPNESVEVTPDMSVSQLALPQLKPKKQIVSYADIIKLQHTSNTKKLFNLVNLLAKKHGITNQNKKPTEIRNNSVLRGSTNEPWTDRMLRTGSVFYPMKFGYVTDTVDHVDDVSINVQLLAQDGRTSESSNNKTPSNPSSKDVTPLPPLTSRPNSQRVESQYTNHDLVSSPKRMQTRNKSMPVLVNDYNRIKKAQSEKQKGNEDYTSNRYSTQSTPSVPRKLNPINAHGSSSNDFSKRSDSVSWMEAFSLLKGVHTLNI